ncbi:MAG: hypothetical protein ACI84D_002255 [Thalassolituus oleivorans]|jgi:hypothetical protein
MPNIRPLNSEYAEYYGVYIEQVPDGAILDILSAQRNETRDFLGSIPQAKAGHRYAPGKWTVSDVLGHVIDAERVFGFRALHIARAASGDIPGMDQDEFASAAPYGNRSLASIARELDLLRAANVEQFSAWDWVTLDRVGIASGATFSVRALLYILAGHERHHMRILRERYL